jgi:AcrR family transcriptional regulator
MARSSPPPAAPRPRQTYRHGDLRRALVEAGVALARQGGPDAVVLREATRRAGVVPNAAYRHFANHGELLQAVRAEALAAASRAIEDELDAVTRQHPSGKLGKTAAVARARARLRAVGMGYVRYALAEPGLFRTGFRWPEPVPGATDRAANTGRSGLNPFELLGAALDELVAAGALPVERRPHAEFVAWSAVHGLALLALDGPLQAAGRAHVHALATRVLDMVERGI